MISLDSTFGVSKQSFLQNHVILARENDRFYNNKCLVCWDSYNEDHVGVRILPCNHIFGHKCLQQIIDSPHGYECPLCHVALFRPPIHVVVGQLCAKLFGPPLIRLVHIRNRLWHTIPEGVRITITLLLDLNNPLFWATKIASVFTGFWERCPHFNLENDAALLTTSHWMPYITFCTILTFTRDDFESFLQVATSSELCATAIEMGAVIWHLLGLHERFERRQDWIFFIITTMSTFCLKLGIMYLGLLYFSSNFLYQGFQNMSAIVLGNTTSGIWTSYVCEMISEHPFVQHNFMPILGNQTFQARIENSCILVGALSGQPIWVECNITRGMFLDNVPR